MRYTMPGTAHPEAPALPVELARQIVQHLDLRDVCSAALAGSKAFWQLGCALCNVEPAKTVRSYQHVVESMESIQLFLARRVPTGLASNASHVSRERLTRHHRHCIECCPIPVSKLMNLGN